MKENSLINIERNEVWSFFAINPTMTMSPYPFCLFQYSRNTICIVNENRNLLIGFCNNKCKQADCFNHAYTYH